jgi:hypothetical protein
MGSRREHGWSDDNCRGNIDVAHLTLGGIISNVPPASEPREGVYCEVSLNSKVKLESCALQLGNFSIHLSTTELSTMQLLKVLSLATAATAAATPSLQKRCSPLREEGLALGYYPPAPCWQTFNTACQPFLAKNTQMIIDPEQHLVIVYGVPAYCGAEIAEELAREASGEKNYGWVEKHGFLTFLQGGTLVISGMSEDAIKRYQKLTYLN